MRLVLALAVVIAGSLVATATAAAPGRLSIPYDVELDSAGRVFIADGGKHRVFRWNAQRKRLVVVAGTGVRGSTGDGGPATEAQLDEVVGLAFDRGGNLYVSDVHNGVVRRIDRLGVITTAAHVPAATGISIDPSGRYLAVASISDGVVRVELATGTRESVLAVGQQGLRGPHGLAYDARGNIWVADPGGSILRVAPSGSVVRVARISAFKVLPLAGGGALVVNGTSAGGRVRRLSASGRLTVVAGTGERGRHRDGVKATRAGMDPTDVAVMRGGAIVVAVTGPVPSIRKVDRRGRITTLVR